MLQLFRIMSDDYADYYRKNFRFTTISANFFSTIATITTIGLRLLRTPRHTQICREVYTKVYTFFAEKPLQIDNKCKYMGVPNAVLSRFNLHGRCFTPPHNKTRLKRKIRRCLYNRLIYDLSMFIYGVVQGYYNIE